MNSVDDVYAGVSALEKRVTKLEWEQDQLKEHKAEQDKKIEEFRTLISQHRELVNQSLDELERATNAGVNKVKDRVDERFNKLYFVVLGMAATLVGGMAMYIITHAAAGTGHS